MQKKQLVLDGRRHRFTHSISKNNAFSILDAGFPYRITIPCEKQTHFLFRYGDIENEWLLLNDPWLVRESSGVVAAGWPEANAILLPSVSVDSMETLFLFSRLYGETSQSGIWIMKYSIVYVSTKSTCTEDRIQTKNMARKWAIKKNKKKPTNLYGTKSNRNQRRV